MRRISSPFMYTLNKVIGSSVFCIRVDSFVAAYFVRISDLCENVSAVEMSFQNIRFRLYLIRRKGIFENTCLTGVAEVKVDTIETFETNAIAYGRPAVIA